MTNPKDMEDRPTGREDMIERVARAMYDASRAASVFNSELGFPNEYDMRMARAAIEAMREPTEAMLMAVDWKTGTGTVWQDMIDAALNFWRT